MTTLTQGGPALNSSSTLTSPNGFFILGFWRTSFPKSNASSYLGIRNINSTRTLWTANPNFPIPDDSGSLALDQDGNLKLTYSGGGAIELLPSSRRRNSTAQLEDTGNFAVRDDSGDVLWQSFDSPTNSWLPGMKLGAVNGRNLLLTSWESRAGPGPTGAFTLEWGKEEEELVMKRRGSVFWTSGKLLTPTLFQNLNFLNDADIEIRRVSNPGEDYLIFSTNQLNFSFLRLGDLGVIYQEWTFPSESSSRRIADCDGNGTENGCRRWQGPECRRSNGDSFQLLRGASWVWKNGSNGNLSASDCKDMCWKDCECGGTTTGGVNGDGSGCRLFKYGEFSESLCSWLICAERFLAEMMEFDAPNDMYEMENKGDRGHDHLMVYSMTSIMTATDNFSLQNKLGQGGFGPVYKGKLPQGKEVAVKRLSKTSGQGLVEFRNELILIAKLQHTNLVRLLGCCINGEEKMLVYEYMANKSLDTFLFDESKKLLLDWNKRFNVIEGIAQGLLYLHKYSRVKIVHRDLKVSNILLDENLNPKISDFGMARIFNTNALEASTNRPVGTYGYMSPEYAMDGTFSTKSDVFSFEVMVLEIVSGRKNYGLIQLDPPINLVGYAWKLWKEGVALQLMDPVLTESYSNKDQILRCINVGLLCIEYNAYDRPTISEVITMLTSEATQLHAPKQPAFTVTRPRNISTNSSSSASNPKTHSINKVTMTTISGR
ncbi:unnamed protein product [Linum tenue]|uniref:Receptor-like serine/threonine-protein kinase n=1 Tax=Linum tenue TaxID=586396 RepID=A0AAV0NG10_9ROSI|nr:unnamed protein product [Linum tenue]